MDFGISSPQKKRAAANAKKAMKLRWKEGITLAQAWKKVKSGKKTSPKRKRAVSPKRKRAGSPKRKRAVSSKRKSAVSPKRKSAVSPKRKRAIASSKKAMNIMWKEGISLKKAWSKVSRFGDTVCPRDYEPNPLWNNTDSRQQCIKMCRPGLVRNPITNRCIKMRSDSPPREVLPGYEINPETGRTRRIPNVPAPREVLPGYEINPRTGRMRRIRGGSSYTELLPGYEINPATGRTRRECPPGKYRDPVSLRCKNISSFSIEPLIAPPYDPPYDSYVPPVVPNYVPFGGTTLMDFGFSKRYNNMNFGGRCGFGSCAACK